MSVIRKTRFPTKTLTNLFHEKIVKTLKAVQNLKFWSNHSKIFKRRFCILRKTYFTTKTLTNVFREKRCKTVAKQLKNWSFSQISKSAFKLDFQLKMNSLSWKNRETSEFGAKFENFFETRFCVIRNTRFTARTLENVFYERKAQNSRKTVQNLNFFVKSQNYLKNKNFCYQNISLYY